ncbi:DUF943 family protein [[Pantoea] beijingensis]|nr:DUF943 family protein [[Pantoea] beijingensis]
MNKQLTGIVAAAACGYMLWQYLTPVEIVAVHDGIQYWPGIFHT